MELPLNSNLTNIEEAMRYHRAPQLGRQETPDFEIWASALVNLLRMTTANSKVREIFLE